MVNLFKKINLFTILIAMLTFTLGWQLGHKDIQVQWQSFKPTLTIENKEPPQNINIDFKLFWDTWDLVSRQYLDSKAIDGQKLFYGAISGMVSAIGDPYTSFYSPEQQKFVKDELNGSFEGVGIQLGFNKDKRLVVMAPLSGTPAEKAGILSEDLILKIDNKDTLNMALLEAVKLIRGPKGTEVKLNIFREGEDEVREISLTRDTIVVKSVEVKFDKTEKGEKVAVIKLSRFGERTKEEWQSGVSEVLASAPQALILDLRNNPGGLLDGAVFIASEFLDQGVVVSQETRGGGRFDFRVNRVGKLTKLPMVVIINKGSASASEIVAGALKDHNRAKLVGEKTFGKGTIQQAEDLPGGTGLHITVAKWLTPQGLWVNDTDGLKPDIVVKAVKKDDNDQQKDVQLKKALEVLDGK